MLIDWIESRLPYMLIALGNILILVAMKQWQKEMKKELSTKVPDKVRAQTWKRVLFFVGSMLIICGWFWAVAE